MDESFQHFDLNHLNQFFAAHNGRQGVGVLSFEVPFADASLHTHTQRERERERERERRISAFHIPPCTRARRPVDKPAQFLGGHSKPRPGRVRAPLPFGPTPSGGSNALAVRAYISAATYPVKRGGLLRGGASWCGKLSAAGSRIAPEHGHGLVMCS